MTVGHFIKRNANNAHVLKHKNGPMEGSLSAWSENELDAHLLN